MKKRGLILLTLILLVGCLPNRDPFDMVSKNPAKFEGRVINANVTLTAYNQKCTENNLMKECYADLSLKGNRKTLNFNFLETADTLSGPDTEGGIICTTDCQSKLTEAVESYITKSGVSCVAKDIDTHECDEGMRVHMITIKDAAWKGTNTYQISSSTRLKDQYRLAGHVGKWLNVNLKVENGRIKLMDYAK